MQRGLNPDLALAELCTRRYYRFFQEFWDTIEAVPLAPSWHLEYLCNVLQETYETWARGESQDDVIINVPPGTSKSSVVTKLFPAWLWVKAPHAKVLSASYSADLSTSHAMKSRDCMKSEKYRRLYGHLWDFKVDKDNKTSYANNKTGERLATGISGSATGFHADFLLFDDPVDAAGAASDKERATANRRLKETFASRKTDKERSVSILVMQRLHEKDPTGNWLEERTVRHICLPGELTKDVKPEHLREKYVDGLLDPVRLSWTALKKMKGDLGSYGYAGQVLQTPSPGEGGEIKKVWFQRFQMNDLPTTVRWNFVADTAYTEKEANDPTGVLAYTIHNGNFYIRDWTAVRKEFPELLKWLVSHVLTHGYTPQSVIYVEPKASGKSIVQTLRQSNKLQPEPAINLNIKEDENPTKDKVARVKDVSPTIEAGRVYLLEGASWVENFLTEVGQFPNAAHDEAVDCLVMMVNKGINKKFSAIGIT